MNSVNESYDETEMKSQQLFQEYFGLNDVFIERAHRVEKWDKSKDGPRTIYSRLLRYENKELPNETVTS